jgi:hypothetical protein
MALALVADQIIIGLNQRAIEEWQEYREEKEKPLSRLALTKSKNFLLKYPEDQQSYLVDTAIMNDWQGLHHIDMPKKNTSRQSDIYQELTDTSWASL